MTILFNFLISILLFIYGINLFSTSLENIYQNKIKDILEKYTKTPLKGIIFGTIITALIQSSTITTIGTVSLVNSNLITFHNSLGIMMGANLGTCITSWFVTFLEMKSNNILLIFNPNTYIPLILLIGLIYSLKKRNNKSNILIGFGLFMLGLMMLQRSLSPISEYAWFKNLVSSFDNPILGVITGMIVTSILQSSSATIAILQTVSEANFFTFKTASPIIMGENIGTCLTTLVASIGTSKNARKVAVSHLLYNIIGTIIFLVIFYIFKFFSIKLLDIQVTSFHIALIHTLFNFFSILIFYPFLKKLEKLINLIVK